MPLKNWCSIHARWSKSSLKHSIHFCGIFPSLKQNFIAYRSSSSPDCIFEIHQSGFSRVYSNCCYCCSFEPEFIKISPSSHKMYNNNILNFQESLNAHTKKAWKLIVCTLYMCVCMYTYTYIYMYSLRIYIPIFLRIYMCKSIYLSIYIYTICCMYIYIHIYVYIYVYIYDMLYRDIYKCVYIYIYIYIFNFLYI